MTRDEASTGKPIQGRLTLRKASNRASEDLQATPLPMATNGANEDLPATPQQPDTAIDGQRQAEHGEEAKSETDEPPIDTSLEAHPRRGGRVATPSRAAPPYYDPAKDPSLELIFVPQNIRKPEYWLYTRCVAAQAPKNEHVLDKSDAINLWCFKCHKMIALNRQNYAKNMIEHMRSKMHYPDVQRYCEEHGLKADAPPHVTKTEYRREYRKRKANAEGDQDGGSSGFIEADEVEEDDNGDEVVRVAPVRPTNTPRAKAAAKPKTKSRSKTKVTDKAKATVQMKTKLKAKRNASEPDDEEEPKDQFDDRPSSNWSDEDWDDSQNFSFEYDDSRTPAQAGARDAEETAFELYRAEEGSWLGEFKENPFWYHLQMKLEVIPTHPLDALMMHKFMYALPPCDGRDVLDICAGTGRAAVEILRAYPTARVEMIDMNAEHLNFARTLVDEIRPRPVFPRLTTRRLSVTRAFTATEVDLVVGTMAFEELALQAIIAGTDRFDAFLAVFRRAWQCLRPGGHLVFGGSIDFLTLGDQLEALKNAGFKDVTSRWNDLHLFVAGGRKPLGTNAVV